MRTVFSAGPCISLLKSSIIEGDNPVYDMDYQCIMIQSLRVELFGNAALNGRYISSKAKYWPETDSAQVE